MSSKDLGSPTHELSTNQERLLYLLSLYRDDFISIPHISVLIFEGTKEPEDEDDDNELSVSRRSADIDVDVSDKFTFTYNFFQSFADIQPGVQIQVYSSMVLKNDLRFFKKQGLVNDEKRDVDTGHENCYCITEQGLDLIKDKITEKCKLCVHNIVYVPGTANLISVIVKDKSFYLTSPDGSYEKKSAITKPQEKAEEEAADESGDDGVDEDEMRRQNFQLSKVQKNLSVSNLDADDEAESKSKACVIQ
eukprot:CAMPEP_0114418420 /NCGR_PEP_ID=MMETSP0103-20121206/3488_1 /TAXON_ID=37642 ORGANISM="Paraphysomonas imperforata, Strain PA2" /NCGR_SAMPLE_ID=MMETSP0103 /ASSEMBLY_ACC=CAM_ASM_000201 /LENGTH=248 /DNA_ID=CAMNT_0001586779 /DNA_START=228 /DNA_END=974 /DNA_ORIENTATION=-